ncbi:MAG: sigma 54-interacting transcriptional regulator [Desulfamplus sp.]|nr:sigma 54-interacting transcriptional regulator [Desulfamplus sp.]
MIKSSFDLFKSFAGELDPAILQKKFLLALLKLQNVERGSIWIKKNKSYHCIEAAGTESESIIGIDIDERQKSIVGWVIENGRRTVADTQSDARHYKELEDNIAVKSSLILCFPLFLNDTTGYDNKTTYDKVNKTVYGAVQIIDTTPEKSCVNLDEKYLNYLQNLVDIGSVALSNAVIYSQKVQETESLKVTLQKLRAGTTTIVGQSKKFQACMNLVKSYAASDFHVLITGESGTGKELVAQEIHRLGSRRDKPFLVQNCSAIPESLLESELFGYKKGAFSGAVKDRKGLFEAAEGGTVFLDEIGDMPFNIQAAILRVLQNNEVKPLGSNEVTHVNVRIISATNRDIKQMVVENRFRQDLFYRLSVLPIELPPLRERREDIPLLIRYFFKSESLKTGVQEKKLKPDAMQKLISWSWPGNIRELENLIRYIMVVTDDGTESEYIGADLIPNHFFQTVIHEEFSKCSTGYNVNYPIRQSQIEQNQTMNNQIRISNQIDTNSRYKIDFGNQTWDELEENYIRFLLKKNNWNVTWAAKASGLNRSTFASRMRRLGIRKSDLYA